MKRRNNKWLRLMAWLTVALVAAGCGRKTVYHHYEHTPLTGWEKADTLHFEVRRMVQQATVQRDIELRTADTYPFRSLSLIVEQTVLPAGHMHNDTIDCLLITPEGSVLGQGLTLYQYRFPLPDISLDEGDSLSLRVYHNMRRETLPGIADVGIRMTVY